MNFELLFNQAPKIVKDKLLTNNPLRERPDFHPEKNAFEHIRIVTDRLCTTGDIDLILTGLFHDIMKFDTHKINPKNGYPTSPGHEGAAKWFIENNQEIKDWIQSLGGNVEDVKELCKQHMRIKQLPIMRESKQRIMREHPLFDKLNIFTRADSMLTPWDENEDMFWLKK